MVSLKKGARADDLLPEIRALPLPVVVGLHRVLIHTLGKTTVEESAGNSEAGPFLDQLLDTGSSVFIVASRPDWEHHAAILNHHGLTRPGAVLISLENWDFLLHANPTIVAPQSPPNDTRSEQLIRAYCEANWRIGRMLPQDFYTRITADMLTVAPILGRTYDPPLISSSDLATMNHPGMMGVKVQSFQPGLSIPQSPNAITLPQAVTQVSQYHTHLQSIGLNLAAY